MASVSNKKSGMAIECASRLNANGLIRESTVVAGLLCAALCMAGTLPTASHAQDEPDSGPSLRFEGYPAAPEFAVVPRKDKLFLYPCSQCHDAMEPNPEIRAMSVMQHAELEHGRGRIWCMSCHDFEDRDNLRTLLGEPVDFDDAHLVCGGCHANRHKDWVFGVHGKRLETWQGDRTQYNCTHCHNPHKPAIAPRAPQPPPPVRSGLELKRGDDHANKRSWDPQEDRER